MTYKAAQYDLSGIRFQVQINEQLKRQIKILELKQKETELNQKFSEVNPVNPGRSRNLASLSPTQPEISFELDPSKLAENFYKEAKVQCASYQKKLLCIEKIESVIMQFPDSKWAGESLLLLTQFYLKNQKTEQAQEIIRIVRSEFKNYPELVKKSHEIEKMHL